MCNIIETAMLLIKKHEPTPIKSSAAPLRTRQMLLKVQQ